MTIQPLKAKQMADLEDADRNIRQFDTVEPVYLRKLALRMETKELAEAIGYSIGGIRSLVDGDTSCRKVVELAAEQIWNDRFATPKADKNVCAFVSGNLATINLVKGMVAQCGGNFTFVEIPKE